MSDISKTGAPSEQFSDEEMVLKRYHRLMTVMADLASTFDVEALIQLTVEAARELTESDGSSLLLYESQTQNLYFEAASGTHIDQITRSAVPIEQSIAGWIFTHNEAVIVNDALNDPRFFREVDALTQFKTNSIVGVPLRTKDKVLGVIEAVNKHSGEFNAEDLQLLQTLAAQAAVAIDNARLFKQSDLVAEIVHELRTPLTALSAAAHLLQRADLPHDQRERLTQTILSEVARLDNMATDFLSLARLESGRASMKREPIALATLIRECLEVVRPQAEAQHIVIETELSPSMALIHGDRNLLKQMLLNLITNAVKYNRKAGRVKVALKIEMERVVLEVSDNGRGIPDEYIDRIFERFFRVPDEETRVGGTGLGLVIARRIAEGHQGEITVESELGVGSVFRVYLPATREEGPPTTRPRTSPPDQTRPPRS